MGYKIRVLLATTMLFCSTHSASAAVLLGTAGDFAVLAGTTVTNTGPSVIDGGHVGVSPGSSITGFPPGSVTPPFTIHSADAVALQAQSDLTTAYNAAAGLAPTQDLTGQDLGGLTLLPGVYFFSSSAQLTGTLTLNNLGDPNAEFVFQIGSTLTTASNSSVVTINGGPMPGCTVFWQVGSSATLGTGTAFEGHILALTSITMTTGATMLNGSALARNGAVTLDSNTITNCVAAIPEPGSFVMLLLGGAFLGVQRTLTRTRSACQKSCVGLCVAAAMTGSLPTPSFASPVHLDFETEDDFVTPLVHGQSIYSNARPNLASPSIPFASDTVLEFGNLVSISSTILGSDGHLGPAVFDSDAADTTSTQDPDLLVNLGNVLILHRDEGPNTNLDAVYGLKFNNPNDEASFEDRGSIIFDFLVPLCRPMSITLVDVDDNVNMTVVLTDVAGRKRTFLVPENWTTDVTENPAGFQVLNLETLINQPAAPNATGGFATSSQDSGYNENHIIRLEVQILGSSPSGAIDNLVFNIVPEPTGQLLIASGAAILLSMGRTGIAR